MCLNDTLFQFAVTWQYIWWEASEVNKELERMSEKGYKVGEVGVGSSRKTFSPAVQKKLTF
jgi:hypothetical protein